jgi:hypothetical protein
LFLLVRDVGIEPTSSRLKAVTAPSPGSLVPETCREP